ncbi:hypothetical protein HY636_05755 [Candidatus Woesearchaeota archaeon]|nr:hypothetical protein [Candidatus Woesearchaeota archaeon]
MTTNPTQPPAASQSPATSQPPATLLGNLSSGFDALAGIEEARDVRGRPQTTLDRLLEVGEYFIKEYSGRGDIYFSNVNAMNKDKAYVQLYQELEGQKLKGVDFTEEDLRQYVLAKANSDYSAEIQQKVLGMYTGALLQLLTERNKEQEKLTIFQFNGRGNRFDYLFYFAKFIDNIIIENFTGNGICGYIGSYNGNVNEIMCINIEGEGVCSNVGSYNGHVNSIILINGKGKFAASNIGSNKGHAEHAISINQDGDYTLADGGGHWGNLEHTIIINNVGKQQPFSVFNASKGTAIRIADWRNHESPNPEYMLRSIHYTQDKIVQLKPLFEKVLCITEQMKDKPLFIMLMLLNQVNSLVQRIPFGKYDLEDYRD